MSKFFKKSFLFLLLPVVLVVALGVLVLSGRSTATVTTGCTSSDFSGLFKPDDKLAYIGSESAKVPPEEKVGREGTEIARVLSSTSFLGERWVEVDLSEQKLTAWEGDKMFLTTSISSGLPWTPTPQGEFKVWIKVRYTKMEGGEGRYYYYLPNVPYVMFFENGATPGFRGYGLHGTYWHNDFGTPRSHGCVNLPTPIAKEIFYWLGPVLPDGKSIVKASTDNPGGRIVIHD